jgi:DNA-directed RNA polymerase subunit beta
MVDTSVQPLRERHTFAKIPTAIPLPNLIAVQKKSYERFLQADGLSQTRENVGLQEVFNTIFPISDFRETAQLQFVGYTIGEKAGVPIPTFNEEECQTRGMTYAVPLRVTFRLVVWDKDADTGTKTIRDIKEQEVYLGDIPLMTKGGTFIINGTERVIVSQLHRSPGVFFHTGKAKTLFTGQVIPYRGSWVEFEVDARDMVQIRIDRRRKFPATIFLKALGLETDEAILRRFLPIVTVQSGKSGLRVPADENILGFQFSKRIAGEKGKFKGKQIVGAGRPLTKGGLKKLIESKQESLAVEAADLDGAHTVHDIPDPETGEVLVRCNEEVTPAVLDRIIETGAESFDVFFPEHRPAAKILSTTLRKDTVTSKKEALIEIYRKMRPGDPPTPDSSRNLFKNMFTNPQRYDFSRVGRLKFNHKLGTDKSLDERLLDEEDFIAVIQFLLGLPEDPRGVDDIDNLGNRRVRSVGELLENQFRIGLVRMERGVREKMSVYQEIETAMPHDLINPKPVMAAVREFFGSSQLSQFMDQTNPLSEVTHKRRLSALGPGGLSRERAGFEVRDVHPTHYGRICPIETPEGPNIGLISSLSCYGRVNEFGFIESPYRPVEKSRIADRVRIVDPGKTEFEAGQELDLSEVSRANRKAGKKGSATWEYAPVFLSATQEGPHVIAQANAPIDPKNFKFLNDRVTARVGGDFRLVPVAEVDFIDVSPKQVVSVAASLIPFLENDDANRALMGSNMQRQAVPLYRPQAPYVGTGMEATTAQVSGAVVLARRDGVVDYVDSERIIVRTDDGDCDIYALSKFRRSNQNTCMNQKALVASGTRVHEGQVLADGPATEMGELALGQNVLVAFMPWRGYNFEDAIVLSEKLVKNDAFTSIHIDELEIEARDTKLGPEEITRDIPNVSEEALRNLDESGVIRIGAEVGPGDILVGKVAPKGETQLTPEEKLLRAIFGEKAGDVKDASLTVRPGIAGTIVDVKVFTRKGVDKDARAVEIEDADVARLQSDLQDEIRVLKDGLRRILVEEAGGKTLEAGIKHPATGEVLVSKGAAITEELIGSMPYAALGKLRLAKSNQALEKKIHGLIAALDTRIAALTERFEERQEAYRRGDELPPGVIKMVKVYIAMKRKIQAGDKMAGRHGNKGVIATVLPEEDMPFLEDGTPVEIVLNPLGVPSRMNVGQVLETHLGWAAKALGVHFATPVFDGATEAEIHEKLAEAGLPESGKAVLRDGLTGDRFDRDVTVGYIYMLKLSHMVDDKIHARSIGPYSLITQQPLGGKAQFGGQRFGEMEVWALEAYGAAHTLQELLTVKSDDVYGRAKIFESIVRGEGDLEPGLPESFNVLVKELQGLGLDVELYRSRRDDDSDSDPELTL